MTIKELIIGFVAVFICVCLVVAYNIWKEKKLTQDNK